MSQTHEINPPKGPYQRIVERLSIQTAQVGNQGGAGEPEFTTADMARATAGLGQKDEIAALLPGVMREEAPAVNRCCQVLDLWGWTRWRIDWPDKQITGALHGRLAAAVVADYQAGGKGYPISQIRDYLKVSGRRFTSLAPHWYALQKRLQEAEGELVHHLRQQLRREVA